MKRLIVDSCVWFALLDPRDEKHVFADRITRVLEINELIVPFPTLYETINTRLTRNEYHQMEGLFEQLLREGHVTMVPDAKYREKALQMVNENIPTDKTYSLVDMVIRLIMEDVTLGEVAVFTFNIKDFMGVNSVEVVSPEWV